MPKGFLMENNIWLPSIKACCKKCDEVIIKVQSNLTLHFATKCPVHGVKGIESPFAKSVKIKYTVEVSGNARTMGKLL